MIVSDLSFNLVVLAFSTVLIHTLETQKIF